MAGEWIITPSATLEETFTDNVRSTRGDRESDYITSPQAGLSVVGTGARVQLNFNYSISKDMYLETEDLDSTRQRFLGVSNVELWEDNVFLDSRAALSQRTINTAGAEAAGERDLGSNQTQVLTYSISPSFRRRYAGWAESDIRYRLSGSKFMETDVGEKEDAGAAQPDDRFSHELTTGLRNGPRFSRLNWEMNSVDSITYRGEDDISKRRTSTARTEYFINRFVSARSSLGYESIDEDDFARDLSGLTWSVGSRLTPGPRTEVIVDFGQRFQENVWSIDASYDLGESAKFTFSLKEEVETEQESLDRNLQGLTTGALDPVTGLPGDPIASDADLIDQTSRTQTALLSVSGQILENSRYTAQVKLLTREFNSPIPGEVTGEEQLLTYTLVLTREINPRTTLTTRARYTDTLEPKAIGEGKQTVSASIGLSYKFAEELSGELRYNFRHQAPEAGDGTTENSATVRLRKQF